MSLLVLLKEMVRQLGAEVCVARLRLLGDESFDHVVQRDLGTPDRLAVEDFAEPPQPKHVSRAVSASRVAGSH